MKGRKISGAGPNLAWLKGTGAVGVQTNLGTLYNDLKTGIFDGTILFITAAVPAKLYEIAPHYNKVDFGAMFVGAIGVNLKQTNPISSSYDAWAKAGGKVSELSAAERAKLIKTMPNPTRDWMAQAGPTSKKVLAGYMDAVRGMGYKFPRDFDKE